MVEPYLPSFLQKEAIENVGKKSHYELENPLKKLALFIAEMS
jgi:hypothetical protein